MAKLRGVRPGVGKLHFVFVWKISTLRVVFSTKTCPNRTPLNLCHKKNGLQFLSIHLKIKEDV